MSTDTEPDQIEGGADLAARPRQLWRMALPEHRTIDPEGGWEILLRLVSSYVRTPASVLTAARQMLPAEAVEEIALMAAGRDAQPPPDRPRVSGALYPPDGIPVTMDAEHLLTDPPVPPGWDRIEGGGETFDDDDADERALQILEIRNERAGLDLQRDRLAHDRCVASDQLRMTALETARSMLFGVDTTGIGGMTPNAKADFLEAQYRRILGLLEEPDPAGTGARYHDEQDKSGDR